MGPAKAKSAVSRKDRYLTGEEVVGGLGAIFSHEFEHYVGRLGLDFLVVENCVELVVTGVIVGRGHHLRVAMGWLDHLQRFGIHLSKARRVVLAAGTEHVHGEALFHLEAQGCQGDSSPQRGA